MRAHDEYKKLGKEFQFYIEKSNQIFKTNHDILIHSDGKDFKNKYINNFNSDELGIFNKILVLSCKQLVTELKSSRIAYIQSDEINIMLNSKFVEHNFDNRLQKINSFVSSKLTLLFSRNLTHYLIDNKVNSQILELLSDDCPFSTKTYDLPIKKMQAYMYWRQFAIANYSGVRSKELNHNNFGTFLIYNEDLEKYEENIIDLDHAKIVAGKSKQWSIIISNN